MFKNCKICNELFEIKSPRQVYCKKPHTYVCRSCGKLFQRMCEQKANINFCDACKKHIGFVYAHIVTKNLLHLRIRKQSVMILIIKNVKNAVRSSLYLIIDYTKTFVAAVSAQTNCDLEILRKPFSINHKGTTRTHLIKRLNVNIVVNYSIQPKEINTVKVLTLLPV